jgi:hypothetical protein
MTTCDTFIMSETRQCSKCNNTKSLELFRKRTNCKDGYGSVCLECSREYNRIKQESGIIITKEILQQRREYREANKDKFNQYQREYKAKKRAEKNAAKPLPDIEFRLRGEMRMVSELTSDELKELRSYEVTIPVLKVIAKRNKIKIEKSFTKKDIIDELIKHDVLSEVTNMRLSQQEIAQIRLTLHPDTFTDKVTPTPPACAALEARPRALEVIEPSEEMKLFEEMICKPRPVLLNDKQ